MKVEFDKISDESRIWIYQSNDDFTEFDVDVINKKSDLFVSNWMAHNKELEASFKILNNRFLVIAVNEEFNPIGGCSIDYSLQLLKDISNYFSIVSEISGSIVTALQFFKTPTIQRTSIPTWPCFQFNFWFRGLNTVQGHVNIQP